MQDLQPAFEQAGVKQNDLKLTRQTLRTQYVLGIQYAFKFFFCIYNPPAKHLWIKINHPFLQTGSFQPLLLL